MRGTSNESKPNKFKNGYSLRSFGRREDPPPVLKALCARGLLKLYKYLPSQFLNTLVLEGKFLFRTLSYFQDFEDSEVRGDTYEGIHKYAKVKGIEINNISRGEDSKEQWTFKSKVRSEEIFIFSTSTVKSRMLAEEFGSDVCVEFTNFGEVLRRLNMAVRLRKKIKPNKLFSGSVRYYSESEAPGIDWAFPERIASRKLEQFSRQQEHRLMYSLNNALEYGHTTQELEISPSSGLRAESVHKEMILKVGNISKWCKIHEFA